MRALIILLTPLLFQVSYAEKKKIQPMESCSQIRKSTNHMVARIKEYCGSKKRAAGLYIHDNLTGKGRDFYAGNRAASCFGTAPGAKMNMVIKDTMKLDRAAASFCNNLLEYKALDTMVGACKDLEYAKKENIDEMERLKLVRGIQAKYEKLAGNLREIAKYAPSIEKNDKTPRVSTKIGASNIDLLVDQTKYIEGEVRKQLASLDGMKDKSAINRIKNCQ